MVTALRRHAGSIPLAATADFRTYYVRTEADVAYEGINFTVLENGLCILLSGVNELQDFNGSAVHKVLNPPIDANMRTSAKGGGVFFLNGNSVFAFKMVK